MKDCFNMDVSPDYFKWKYFENPAGKCVGFLALESGTGVAISFYGAIPQRYVSKDTEMIIYQQCDTMTHSGHRKKSLFPVLLRETINYLRDNNRFYLMGIGGVKESFPVLAYFGFKIFSRFRLYFRPRLLCVLSHLKKYTLNNFTTEGTPEAIHQLVARRAGTDAVHSPKDPAQYSWRLRNPNYHYTIISYKENDMATGFVVYLLQNKKIFLIDYVFTNSTSRKALFWYLSKQVLENHYKGNVDVCQEVRIHIKEL